MTSFIVTGADLSEAAAWAARITSIKPSVPVLSGLLLEAGDELRCSAFDFDTSVSATMPCTTTEPGRLLVSARLLAAVAKTVDRDVDVHIGTGPGEVSVRCGRSEWTLPALPVDEYPALPPLGPPVGSLRSGDLRRALARVLPAAGDDASLAMLTGVKVEADADGVTLIATDRYRLAVATLGWEPDPSAALPIHALVPAELMELVVRSGNGETDTVAVSCTDNTFGLATDTHTVTGRLVAAEFPRWRPLVPELLDWRATVDTASLTRAAEQAMVAVGDEPCLILHFADGEVEVSASGSDRRAKVPVKVELEGRPITVKVNAGYLRDGLSVQTAPTIEIYFSGPNRPMLLVGEGEAGYRHLLMPMRVEQRAAAA